MLTTRATSRADAWPSLWQERAAPGFRDRETRRDQLRAEQPAKRHLQESLSRMLALAGTDRWEPKRLPLQLFSTASPACQHATSEPQQVTNTSPRKRLRILLLSHSGGPCRLINVSGMRPLTGRREADNRGSEKKSCERKVRRMYEVVIVGGGFAGVWTAAGVVRQRIEAGADESELRVTLVSAGDDLVMRPRLY
jgi:hypothetical protein